MSGPARNAKPSTGRPGLKARLVTAGILATAVLAAIWWLPPPALGATLGVFLALGAWEWSALIGWNRRQTRIIYAAMALAAAAAAYPLVAGGMGFQLLLVATLAAWIAALGAIIARQQGRDVLPGSAIPLAVLGWLALVTAWLSLVWLAVRDTRLLVGLLLMVWLADSLAYFAGRRWGRRRLVSEVSPGKTWAGFVGAMLGTPALAALSSLTAGASAVTAGRVMALALATVAASVVGDLFESLLKRRRGVKDSGSLLPGHGGVLDRIDSLLAAAPVYAFGLLNLRLVA